MISVDTNLLIYAADPDSPKHERLWNPLLQD